MAWPTGTVTFLFTDVEGSTKRWEASRDAMQSALALHDRLIRSAIEAHDGWVFKSVGDEFCTAFPTASRAVAAALDVQRSLRPADFTAVGGIRVRIALHTGTAEERDGDYFGPALNRVARLLAIGYGGQILLSRSTADLVQGELPAGSSLYDLGEHRLKDLSASEHVYQLVASDLPKTFPPLRSLGRLANNLPQQVTSFVGRDEEIAQIKKLVEQHRLVTLVGMGGGGKTRCATQVASELLGGYANGVWLVELAPISSGSLVVTTIARTVGARESSKAPLFESLLTYLERWDSLIVLDNCEHVLDDVRNIVAATLRRTAGVRIFATSREALNIAGEHAFLLPSLNVPPIDAQSPDAVLRYGAAVLFNDRAQAADARFILTNENARFVAEITRRLDGIPLAIELAAARVKVLSPQQLAQRLNERFRVLTGGDRSALPRHQTMRALIDWSYDLLSERERTLFRKVSIFADIFTLDGATAVGTDDGGDDELSVLDLLSSLVDKSLLQTDPGIEDRYRLLESTRQYAREKLFECGELASSGRRHLDYLSQLFRKSAEADETMASTAAVAGLTAQLEDARNALDWGAECCASDAADLFLATRLWIYLGLNREAIDRAQRLIGLLAERDVGRLARLWERVAASAAAIGHYASAKEGAQRAVQYARESGDSGILADCLLRYAVVMGNARAFDEAGAALDEAEALASPSLRRELQALNARGFVASIEGNLEIAARSYAQLRDRYRALGSDAGTVSIAINLAETEYARGATAQAIAIANSELSRAESLPDRGMWAQLQRNLAGYLAAAADVEAARRASLAAITFYAANDPAGPLTAVALEHLALCKAIDADVQTAALLEGYVEKTLTQLGFEREYTENASRQHLLEILANALPAEDIAAFTVRGERMEWEEALASAGLPEHA